jgi:II/X family phage/plasmid replication protein
VIDKLRLRCFFKTDYLDFDLTRLGVELECRIDPNGTTHSLRHPWESIPSSFSGLGFKVFFNPSNSIQPNPYIEITGSPAKLAQGHNVFGSDSLRDCALVLAGVLFTAYPQIADALDMGSWDVCEADITYFSRADNPMTAQMFIRSMQSMSKGHTKSRDGYSTTSYFGNKKSRYKKIKIYLKYEETLNIIDDIKKKGDKLNLISTVYQPRLLEYAKNMIRWELTVKKAWLTKIAGFKSTLLTDLVKIWDSTSIWEEGMKELLSILEGEEMYIHNDQQVLNKLRQKYATVSKSGLLSYGAATSAYETYLAIKERGYTQVKLLKSKATMSRHLKMLTGIGFSLGELQNIRVNNSAVVIPLKRYSVVNFQSQLPEWALTA